LAFPLGITAQAAERRYARGITAYSSSRPFDDSIDQDSTPCRSAEGHVVHDQFRGNINVDGRRECHRGKHADVTDINPIALQAVDLLQTACDDLRNANKFKDLLNVILMMGNFMNGSNYGGGAYGFKIGSINRVRIAGVLRARARLTLLVLPVGRYQIIEWTESPAFPGAYHLATFPRHLGLSQ
jgi:hypothetical protein